MLRGCTDLVPRASAQRSRTQLEAHINAYAFTQRLAHSLEIMPKRPTAQHSLSSTTMGGRPLSSAAVVSLGDRSPHSSQQSSDRNENGQPAKPFLSVEAIFVAEGARLPKGRRFAAWLFDQGAQIRQDTGKQAVTAAGVTPTDDPIISAVLQQSAQAVPLPTDSDISNVWRAQKKRRPWSLVEQRQANRGECRLLPLHLFSQSAYPSKCGALLAVDARCLGRRHLVAASTVGQRRSSTPAPIHRGDYLWVLPAGVAMLILVALPFVMGAAVSLYAHQGGEWTFVGLSHWEILASEVGFLAMSFWCAVVTLLWTVATLFAVGVVARPCCFKTWLALQIGDADRGGFQLHHGDRDCSISS